MLMVWKDLIIMAKCMRTECAVDAQSFSSEIADLFTCCLEPTCAALYQAGFLESQLVLQSAGSARADLAWPSLSQLEALTQFIHAFQKDVKDLLRVGG